MVEQEHSKSSSVFPEALISNKGLQNYTSNSWLANSTAVPPEESYNSDFLNIELLYGSVLSTDESFIPSNIDENMKERDRDAFHEVLPNDIFISNDLTPCDLCYNDKSMSLLADYWHPGVDKFSSDPYFEDISPVSFWGNGPFDLETLKMEDVFQVDKDDIVQSPTLAQLNANNDESFDNFCMPIPSEDKLVKSTLLTPCSNAVPAYKMPSSTETSEIKVSPKMSSDRTNNPQPNVSRNIDSIPGTVAGSSFNVKENESDSLSSNSADKKNNSQVVTKLIKQSYPANESDKDPSEEKKIENDAEVLGLFNSETCDSEDDDSEMDCDYSSDVDEDSEEETKVQVPKQGANNMLLQKKKSRYFWQYNIQSKGPKAPKMKLDSKTSIMDDLPSVSDPVFTSSFLMKGVKHAGKARRGDGNDLTPNPQKLYNIGLELEKLTSVIEGLIPANELPLNARSKSRKEKNKLASRACRLKKKAQHEANKLKLFGLQKEQKHLLNVISEVKKLVRKGVDNVKHGKMQAIQVKIESLCMKRRYTEVAGRSAEFVNNVLKNVDLGDKSGGLDVGRAHDE